MLSVPILPCDTSMVGSPANPWPFPRIVRCIVLPPLGKILFTTWSVRSNRFVWPTLIIRPDVGVRNHRRLLQALPIISGPFVNSCLLYLYRIPTNPFRETISFSACILFVPITVHRAKKGRTARCHRNFDTFTQRKTRIVSIFTWSSLMTFGCSYDGFFSSILFPGGEPHLEGSMSNCV